MFTIYYQLIKQLSILLKATVPFLITLISFLHSLDNISTTVVKQENIQQNTQKRIYCNMNKKLGSMLLSESTKKRSIKLDTI